MTPQERAEKHWDGYVGPMQRELLAHMVEVCMAMSRFHYVTSHVHGVKHEQQDARETAREAFNGPINFKAVQSAYCGNCHNNQCDDVGRDKTAANCSVFVGETARAAFTPVQDPCAKCATGECNEHKEIAAKLAGACEERVQEDAPCDNCATPLCSKEWACAARQTGTCAERVPL